MANEMAINSGTMGAIIKNNDMKQNPEKYKNIQQNQIGYWTKQGFTEEEAIQKVSETQTTFSKEICIKKLGEVEGMKRWQERQEKWLVTLDNKSDKEKTKINLKKAPILEIFINKYGEVEGIKKHNSFIQNCKYKNSLDWFIKKYGKKGEQIFLNYYSLLSLDEYYNNKNIIYSKNWTKIANNLKQEQNYICQYCGSSYQYKKKIHVHHIDFNKSNNDKSNLIVLCDKCHHKSHYYFEITREELYKINGKNDV